MSETLIVNSIAFISAAFMIIFVIIAYRNGYKHGELKGKDEINKKEDP